MPDKDEHTIADTVEEIRAIRLADMEPKYKEITVKISEELIRSAEDSDRSCVFLSRRIGSRVINGIQDGETEIILKEED